jgi:hypothetical protein
VALARALGLNAPVTDVDNGWTVSEDGRVLRVERQPGLPWYFSPYAGDIGCATAGAEPRGEPVAPDTPVASDGCGTSGSAGGGTVTTSVAAEPCPADAKCAAPEPAPLPVPERPADLPTREQAEGAARALFAKAGIDLAGAAVRVDDGFTQWFVEFEPEVGGLPTLGFSSGASIGPKGVVDAHGWLAQPDPADEYPLVTSAAGFERLKTSPYGTGPEPLIAADAPIACAAVGCPEPGPVVRTVTGVRLGLTFAALLEPGDQGRALLVPVFLFDVEDGAQASAAGSGSVVPVLAVEDELLPKPVEEPRPGATEPAPDPGATEPDVVGGGTAGVASE